MGFAHLAKKENLLESIVGGGCMNCSGTDVKVRKFLEGRRMYTHFRCNTCRCEEIFLERPEDHLNLRHVF